MPQVIFTPTALRDLERLREFLRPKNPSAAKRAAAAIIRTVRVLGEHPQIGRPVDDEELDIRELVIFFGGSGYLARYRVDDGGVTILALRHQKEAGY